MSEQILIIGEDSATADDLELMLSGESYEVHRASTAEAAIAWMDELALDVVLCERTFEGLDGLDILPQLMRRQPGVPILLMCAQAGRESSEDALRRGAHGLLHLPARLEELRFALRRARDREGLRRAKTLLQREVLRATGERPIVAASTPMIDLLEAIERAAGVKAPALLTGEPGTGKEVLARAIHAQSTRRSGPFVAVTCRDQPEERLASELFGHTRGAFEGAERARHGLLVEAHGGSIFLDEVDALPQRLQARLLTLIRSDEMEPGETSKTRIVDVRVIAASSKDVTSEAPSCALDPELLDVLRQTHLRVPALRERRQDIPLLVDHFMAHFGAILGHTAPRLADEALARLTEYSWPRNLRELENVIERALMVAEDGRVTLRDLPVAIVTAPAREPRTERHDFSLKRVRQQAEAELIERALYATKGNRTHAAKLLEISHRALLYKIKDYGIRN